MTASTRKLLRTAATYCALALGVTVGGVAIGAIIVAPVVSSAATPPASIDARVAATPAPMALANAGAASEPMADTSFWGRTGRKAAMFRRDVKAWPLVRNVPERGWFFLSVGATAALALIVGWHFRTRDFGKPVGSFDDMLRTAAALPARANFGRSTNNRTPRAVVALAEAGNAPADIARRTGLPLDAVAMCLTLSQFAARQLRPPTA